MKQETSDFAILTQVNPIVACFLIAGISTIICVAIWQMWKTFRSM